MPIHKCSPGGKTYLRTTSFFLMGQGFPLSVVMSFFLSSTASFNFSSSSGVREPKAPTAGLFFDSESDSDSDSDLDSDSELGGTRFIINLYVHFTKKKKLFQGLIDAKDARFNYVLLSVSL